MSSCLRVESKVSWITDSGATNHMTGSSKLFSSYSPCAGNQRVKIVDGTFLVIVGKGSIVISPNFVLHNVLHVPKISCNLLSVSKLTLDQNCQAKFSSSDCHFQYLTTGRMIGNAR